VPLCFARLFINDAILFDKTQINTLNILHLAQHSPGQIVFASLMNKNLSTCMFHMINSKTGIDL
jgi:hypothetical protein